MQDKKNIIIGSRGSNLALWQSEYVRKLLQEFFPDNTFEIKTIKTTGDKILDAPLSKIGDKGLFTKEIETALLEDKIDLAVHSLKDLPTKLDKGLALGAVMKREDPRDAFVSKNGVLLSDLAKGAKVATSSLRRRAQLLHFRPDINVVDIRGNVDTRLKKLDETEDLSAIILAKAGLKRMGLNGRITHVIDMAVMLPAVGQGALAIEIRENDELILNIVSRLDHEATRIETTAERAMLAVLEGGCQVPIGAFARSKHGDLTLEGVVASLDGKIVFKDEVNSSSDDPKRTGEKLAQILLNMGAQEVLDQIIKDARGQK